MGAEDTGRGAPGPSSCLPGPGWPWQRPFTGNPRYQWRDREFPGASPAKFCGARSFPVSAHTLPSAVLSTWGTMSSFLRTFPSYPASFKQPLSLVQSESESALEKLPLNASSSEPKHPFPAGPRAQPLGGPPSTRFGTETPVFLSG